MRAESEQALDQAGAKVARQLWPGTLRIFSAGAGNPGVDYAASIVEGMIEIKLNDSEGGGVGLVQGLSADISKTVLANEPAPGLVVEVVGGSGRRYRVEFVGGQNPNDADWQLDCVMWKD